MGAQRIAADPRGIRKAAEILCQGGLVAFPTETVYGLGADALDDRAVAGIFAAKRRPRFNPLIVHLASSETIGDLAQWTGAARQLAEAFWPGPLTVVLERRPDSPLSRLVSAGGTSVALRIPAHPIAHCLLEAVGRPIAAPSANRAGRISPTHADHVAADLGDAVDLILDGGACRVGVESTVVDARAEPALLRPGGLPREAIERRLGRPLLLADRAGGAAPSPGMLESHYAPRLPVRLGATTVGRDEALLAFGPGPPEGAWTTLNLSPSGDLVEAAAHLFAMLHELDRSGARGIAAMPIPCEGLGEAIVDRLARAAAPRPEPDAGAQATSRSSIGAGRSISKPCA